MLAYYVQRHMLEAWSPLFYADEDQKAKNLRDPVAPAKRSDSAIAQEFTPFVACLNISVQLFVPLATAQPGEIHRPLLR